MREPLVEMKHQVAADEPRLVGASRRPVLAGRRQQQARRVEPAGGKQHQARLQPQRLPVARRLDLADPRRGAAERQHLAAVDQRGAAGPERRLDARGPAVHLAAPRAHAPEALGAPRQVAHADVLAVGVQALAAQLLGDRDLVVRVRRRPPQRRRRIGRQRIGLAADFQERLRRIEVGRTAPRSRPANRRSDAGIRQRLDVMPLRPLEQRGVEQRRAADPDAERSENVAPAPVDVACRRSGQYPRAIRAAGSLTSPSQSCSASCGWCGPRSTNSTDAPASARRRPAMPPPSPAPITTTSQVVSTS